MEHHHHHSHYEEDGSIGGRQHHSSHSHSHTHTHSGEEYHHHHHASSGTESHHHHHSAPEEEHHRHHSHRGGMHPHERALLAAALSIAAGLLGFTVLVISLIVANHADSSPNPWINGVSATLSIIGLLFCFYAQVVQLRYWSATVRRRMGIGFVICLLVLSVVGADVYRRVNERNFAPVEYLTEEGEGEDLQASRPRTLRTPTDTSVFKPGWYGEAEQGEVTCVVVSFFENAVESRQFQRRLNTPVSYAMLTVMNLGLKTAVVDSVTPQIVDTEGKTHPALSAKELLAERRMENAELLLLLETPKELKSGQMLSSIPVCMPADFDWARVKAVELQVNGKPFRIEGRMVTAEEKQKMIGAPAGEEKKKGPADQPPASPMNAYDNL